MLNRKIKVNLNLNNKQRKVASENATFHILTRGSHKQYIQKIKK